MRRLLSKTRKSQGGHNKKWQQTEGKRSATEGATSETYDWALMPNLKHTRVHTHAHTLSLFFAYTHQINLRASPADFSLLTCLTLPHPISPCHMVPTGCRGGGLERQTQHVRAYIEKKRGNKDRKARRGWNVKRETQKMRRQTNQGFRGSRGAPLRSVG